MPPSRRSKTCSTPLRRRLLPTPPTGGGEERRRQILRDVAEGRLDASQAAEALKSLGK